MIAHDFLIQRIAAMEKRIKELEKELENANIERNKRNDNGSINCEGLQRGSQEDWL